MIFICVNTLLKIVVRYVNYLATFVASGSQDPISIRNTSSFNYFLYFVFVLMLYGCETWSLTLREECRLKVFESRILRRISGLKRGDNGE